MSQNTPPVESAKVVTRAISAASSTTSTKSTSGRTNKSVPTSNEDLMVILKALKDEFLSSNKALSEVQATQYKDLKACI